MDYNLELINNLTADDTKIILDLLKLRDEARSAHDAIKGNIRFSIGEDKKTIWKDQHNAEYITHEGIWQARYLHQTYDVTCTTEGIFDVFKAAYLKNLGGGCLRDSAAESAGYFRSFVRKLEKGEHRAKQ